MALECKGRQLSQIKPAPRYNHELNNAMILKAKQKAKFDFTDQQVHFDMMKEFYSLIRAAD